MREVRDLLTCCYAAGVKVKMAGAAVEDGAATLLVAEVTNEEAGGVWHRLQVDKRVNHLHCFRELPTMVMVMNSFREAFLLANRQPHTSLASSASPLPFHACFASSNTDIS